MYTKVCSKNKKFILYLQREHNSLISKVENVRKKLIKNHQQ